MLIIDRFESDFAVVEYEVGKVFNLPKSLVPAEAKEGSVITISVTVNEHETAQRRKRIRALLDDLFE